MDEANLKLRCIPAIDKLMAAAENTPLSKAPRNTLTGILRELTEKARLMIKSGKDTDTSVEGILAWAEMLLAIKSKSSLQRVVNATGVVLHTNLGRAPLSNRAQKAVAGVMGSYSNLEYDAASGERGLRYAHVMEKLKQVTGGEDALVVNNNAAAVLLALSALAKDREVIVSRGELVEIGGSFRIPDVMKQSGARLVEVGTTNKTHLRDYEEAITPETGAILKVHTSNYRIVGFTAQPAAERLADLAHNRGIPVIEDLGSGVLIPLSVGGWQEPTAAARLANGFDLVTFSGDKLLGAGQAGIIAGKSCYINKMKRHPLLRALRIDKLSLAALEGTLQDYTLGNPYDDIPVLHMLTAEYEELRSRAEALLAALSQLPGGEWTTEILGVNSQTGGGAFPAIDLPGWAVSVASRRISPDHLAEKLRLRDIPIIVRLQDDKVLLDVRCLIMNDMEDIAEAFKEIMDITEPKEEAGY